MKSIRVLQVEDDPVLRSTAKHSLELDDFFILRSCTSTEDIRQIATAFSPDLILCDAMDGIAEGQDMLLKLIKIAKEANVPIVVMTAEFARIAADQLKRLGANGTIFKPFEPFALPELLRGELRSFRVGAVGYDFDKRLRADAAVLKAFGEQLSEEPDSEIISDGLQTCAHKLAGAAGVFNFLAVSEKASALEESVIARRAGRGSGEHIQITLDALLQCIGHQEQLRI